MKAVILAAGVTHRLRPFNETRAKPMIRVAGVTIMDKLAESLKAAGITEILVVVNHQRESIEQHLQHGHHLGLSVEYVLQDPIDGIGGALRCCEKYLSSEPFLLVYGDVLTTGDPFNRVLEQHAESGGAVAAVSLPAESGDFGNVYLNSDMQIVRLVEKPADARLSNHVFAGIFLLPPEIFQLLAAHGNEIEPCYQEFINQGRLFGTLWDGGWIDITRPWHILEANRMLMDGWDKAEIHRSARLEGQVHIEGPVHIEENVHISAGTVLKGPCYIGHNSFVGNNTLIREYTSLGPDSIVGYGTELKNCVLFGRSVLGRLSFIGDSVIGEGVHLGTGVTTVNVLPDLRPVEMLTETGLVKTGLTRLGAFIGDNVSMGARHVLAPGTRIRSGYRVGDLITQETVL